MSVQASLVDWAISHSYHVLASISLISVTGMIFMQRSRRNPRHLPLPPGPKGHPVIGNLLQVPSHKQWLVYNDWGKTYGDMIYFNVLGQPFLVLNTLERAYDIFEKKSSNYSDRMRMPMVVELMGWDYNMALLPYGQWWRRHRKAFQEQFHQTAVARYLPVQKRETIAMLHRLLQTPDNFMHHIRHTFSATIMSVVYGIAVKETEDPYITNAEEALTGLAEAGIPGSFMVDFLPFLKHIPSWLPGAGFQKKAENWRRINAAMRDKPFNYVKEQMAKGTAVPSVAVRLLDQLPPENDPRRAEEEIIARNTAGVAYVGGADTTVSSVQTFFLAMAMYPEAQQKGQAEIDAVIGPNRLPGFEDRGSLPYINALVKESMRWQVVGPMAVGHMCSADDEYDGYYIPKGTIVLGNVWAILHNPNIYPDPLEFKPERYLKDGQLDPSVKDPDCAAFGFGRRICPGRHMSDNSLYAIISSVLATFDIKPPLDAHGYPVQLKPEYTSGMISYPEPFDCVITPRFSTTAAMIRESLEADD